MSTCAVVQEILVVNIIIAEPTDTPPDNCILALIPSNVFVTIGYTYQYPTFYDFDGNPSLPIDIIIDLPAEPTTLVIDQITFDTSDGVVA